MMRDDVRPGTPTSKCHEERRRVSYYVHPYLFETMVNLHAGTIIASGVQLQRSHQSYLVCYQISSYKSATNISVLEKTCKLLGHGFKLLGKSVDGMIKTERRSSY